MPLPHYELMHELQRYIDEDVGAGDLAVPILPHCSVAGNFTAKQAGVISGINIPGDVYQLLGDRANYTPLVADGDQVEAGTTIGRVTGNAQDLLAGERVILNLLQRMSGIATATQQAVLTLGNTEVGIMDTRKTAPGLRPFDKYAVTCGGGINHRMGLYDAVMIKDNHWPLIGDLSTAVQRLRQNIGPTKIIEVEVATPAQLTTAIASHVDMILIDNQSPAVMQDWCQQIPAEIKTEASGGITLANLAAYGETGVDFISLGYLTHSVDALDISFNLVG